MVMLYLTIRRIILKPKSRRDSLFRKEIYVSLDLSLKEILLIFFFFFAFFHLLRILVPGYWQGKSYFKETMKLKDIKRRTMIEIISHNTSVLFSLLCNQSFKAIEMNLFCRFYNNRKKSFIFSCLQPFNYRRGYYLKG